MKRILFLALATGLATSTLAAQTAPAAAPASTPPQAIPAKIAVIAFEQAVAATNEGQRSFGDVQKKYEPQKSKLDALGAEVEALRKQAQALPANAPDDQRANLLKSIDVKEKQLNLDAETAQSSYQDDIQKAYGTVAQKVGQAAVKYAQDNGFTLLVNVTGGQQAPSAFFWWAPQSDISQAVVNAYNASSGIAAPTPSAPSAARPRTTTPSAPRPAGSTTTPRK